MPTLRHFRWIIVALLACATAINYLDRQTFPLLMKTEIQKNIPISDGAIFYLNSLFLAGYGLMYAAGGRIMDRLGTRAGYALMIVWWSAANFAMGTVTGWFGLVAFRLLLGLGEGGGFPGSAKAVSEWIPPKDRAFAFGIFNTGSAVGAVAAPFLIGTIAQELGWRWAFFITGGFGFVWVIGWLFLYEIPSRSRFVSSGERDAIEKAFAEARSDAPDERPTRWLELFRHREIWGLMAAKFVSDAAFYFYALGLPTYLSSVRNMDTEALKTYAWIPWVFAGGGSFFGGWFSSFLFRRTTLDRSRKIALGVSAALMPFTLFVTASPLSLAFVFLSMAYFGHQFFATILQTLPADLFPSRVVGSFAGLGGAAGAFGGMFFQFAVGKIVNDHGPRAYSAVFLVASLMHLLAFVLILTVVRRIRRVI